MRQYSEVKELPFAAAALFEIIADVDSYAEFLPWCVASRVREKPDKETMIADLKIGYRGFTETFASRISLNRSERTVDTCQESGPFKYLRSKWYILDAAENRSMVHFEIEFEFKSILLETMMGAVFETATQKMMSAFEKRAGELL